MLPCFEMDDFHLQKHAAHKTSIISVSYKFKSWFVRSNPRLPQKKTQNPLSLYIPFGKRADFIERKNKIAKSLIVIDLSF